MRFGIAVLSLIVGLVGPIAGKAAVRNDKIAEMTWLEFEREARTGTVVLWAIGSIEEHGPHLPLATDAYVAEAQVQAVSQSLRKAGIRNITLPPYVWGVNQVTGAFPGSLRIRPEAMTMVIEDVLDSLRSAGFRRVFLITGHYDAEHGRAIARAVAEANTRPGLETTFVLPARLAGRLGVGDHKRGVAIVDMGKPPPGAKPDLHAGEGETSMMLAVEPALVRRTAARRARATDLNDGDVAEWRTGGQAARRITPNGYLGAPSAARATKGKLRFRAEVAAYTAAIQGVLRGDAANTK